MKKEIEAEKESLGSSTFRYLNKELQAIRLLIPSVYTLGMRDETASV